MKNWFYASIICGSLATGVSVASNGTFNVQAVLEPGEDQMKDGTFNLQVQSGILAACADSKCTTHAPVFPDAPVSDADAWKTTMTSGTLRVNFKHAFIVEAALDNDQIVTIGYFASKAVEETAKSNPQKKFSIVDFEFPKPIANVQSLMFREDVMGYLAGVTAVQVALSGNSQKVAVLGGQPIPSVKRFVNGFANAAHNLCPNCEIICGYSKSFSNDDNQGQVAAAKLMKMEAHVIAHHAGTTGNVCIKNLAENEKMVMGFGTDEWVTNFGSGTVKGSDYVIGSLLKNVDMAVKKSVQDGLDGTFTGKTVWFGTREGGIGVSDCHEACASLPANMTQVLEQYIADFNEGTVSTGVDLKSGNNVGNVKSFCTANIFQDEPLTVSASSFGEVHIFLFALTFVQLLLLT